MNNLEARRSRYMRDPLSIRLGGLAANLARVGSIANRLENKVVARGLFEESKYFIEWTAQEAEIETAAKLVELQIKLALWQRILDSIWENEDSRHEIGIQSKQLSGEVLRASGLLDQK